MRAVDVTRVQVLGCSGGIGGPHLRTTSLLVDHDILIDAGTGAADLSLGELSLIDHIFITHSHLDHIVSIPFIVDSVGSMRSRPLIVYALPETIEVMQKHIFNWSIWPDFTTIPNPEQPFLIFKPVQLGQKIELGRRTITVLPAEHTVPACGYAISNHRNSLAFTGDTTVNPALWDALKNIAHLRHLIIETAFCNREKGLAELSKHLCPSLLASELKHIDPADQTLEIHITHLKPSEIELTMEEVLFEAAAWRPNMLQAGQHFNL